MFLDVLLHNALLSCERLTHKSLIIFWLRVSSPNTSEILRQDI